MKQATKSTLRRVFLFLLLAVGYVKLQFTANAEEDCRGACEAGLTGCQDDAASEFNRCHHDAFAEFLACGDRKVAEYISCSSDCNKKPEPEREGCLTGCYNDYERDLRDCDKTWDDDIKKCEDEYNITNTACTVGYGACIESCGS